MNTFWKDVERAFADEDNARFENSTAARRGRRRLRITKVIIGVGILASAFAASYVLSVIIFH